MTKMRWLILFAIPALCLSACSRRPAGTSTQSQAGLTAILAIAPDPPAVMEPVQLSLTLSDTEGHPVDGAQVSYDLTMPAMAMPPNRPSASAAGSGLYSATAVFTMSGDWQVQVAVVYKQNNFLFSFPISVP